MQEENLIALLKETLKFYADLKNYDSDLVKNDGGHMARFALDQVKKVEDSMQKLEKAFEELQNKVDDKTPEEVHKMINELMKQNNGR